jgi:hypothetical protein
MTRFLHTHTHMRARAHTQESIYHMSQYHIKGYWDLEMFLYVIVEFEEDSLHS